MTRPKAAAPERRGPGRPRTLEPPRGAARLVVRLDAASASALPKTGRAECVRELLAAYGESAGVRQAVEAWRKERGA